MASLGDFGTPRPPAEDTFGYFGEELRVNADISDIAIIEMFSWLEHAGNKDSGVEDVNSALRQIGETLVHADDVDLFWRTARTNRQRMGDIAMLAKEILSAITDRPTQLPVDSSTGQPTTDTRSEADSSSPATALRLLEGRPDLGVAVLRANEAQLSVSG